jgi:glycogen(starch) synthase
MRVLFWTELFWPVIGGAEIFSSKLVCSLRDRGHEVIVVTRKDSPDLPAEEEYRGIPVYRFPFAKALIDRNLNEVMTIRQQVSDLKRTFGPELVHLHQCGPSVLFHFETIKAYPARLIVTLIVEIVAQLGSTELLRQAMMSADWVTCKTATMLAEASRLAPEISSRSSVIHNGIDIPMLAPTQLPLVNPRILCLGRLDSQKGFDLAVEAWPSIVARFPNARLVIAGDGPERLSLERRITELSLSQTVELIGWVAPDSVPSLMDSATIVVMPSRWEGFPSVGLQAAAMARPIVASRVGGLPDIVADRQTGFTVEAEDAAALGKAIITLLKSPELAVEMGKAGRHRVQKLFGWEQCVDRYDALYRQVADSNAANSHSRLP